MNQLDQAYALCRKRAFGHYENFPVASLLLPQPQRDAIAAIYAFARTADDFSDEPEFGPSARRLALLKGWERQLDRAPSRPEFLALHHAIQSYAIPKDLLRALISAFAQDCVKPRYRHWPEVLDYCRRSADPVGRLVLRVFGADSPEACAESDAICTALQLANFWQDLGNDAAVRDRVYLPQDEMREFGVREEDLKGGRFSAGLEELMRLQVNRAEALFTAGEPLLGRLKGRLRAEIALTLFGGRRILEKIRSQGYDTLKSRPKLGKADAPLLLWRLAWGRPW